MRCDRLCVILSRQITAEFADKLLLQRYRTQSACRQLLRSHYSEFLSAPFLRYDTVFEKHNTVNQILQIPEPVLGNDNGLSLRFPFPDDLREFTDRIPVQIGGRLIQQHDLRHQRGNACTGDFLFFAAGKCEKALIQQRFQRKFLCDTGFSAENFRRRNADVFRAEGNLPVRIDREKLAARILEHRSDSACQFIQLRLCNLPAADIHTSG